MGRKKKVEASIVEEPKFVSVTQEMLDADPTMVEQGIEVGDEIELSAINTALAVAEPEAKSNDFSKGKVKHPYAHTIELEGSRFALISGSLPEGVTLEGRLLSGEPTPESQGVSKFKLMAFDANDKELGEVSGEIIIEL